MLTTLIKKNLGIFLLIVIVSILVIINYRTGTFLSGWDTLHPEFDFGLNFKRLFFGVWRGEQGLGAPAGHAHMADLPRVIFLWILNFILPVSLLRYSYVFICLLLGPLGIYQLIRFILHNNKHKFTDLVAFLSSIYYLLNLATLQQFYVPFEMFPTQYAFLPWIILFSLQFIEEGRRLSLFYFFLFTLLSTPQAYAPQLWYAFFGVYSIFLLFIFVSKKNIICLKRITALIVITLAINSFWLFPNLFYIKTAGSIPSQSKQNQLYSEEFRLRNKINGIFSDVALVKGFYFDWNVYDFQKQKTTLLMEDWRRYSNNQVVLSIGYGLFLLVILGIILSVVKKETNYFVFIPFFIMPFTFLMNNTFPFNILFDFLIKFPIFKEGLRFVFTKFSILLTFSYVVYFSLTISVLFKIMKKKLVFGICILTIFSLYVFVKPMFSGELVSNKMKLTIPTEYFSFWNYMNKQPDGRVLTLPLHNFSGWRYYNWGYQGAGFLWFGLKQSLMDRDFDRWYPYNEQAYQEISYALYSRNRQLFNNSLKKYRLNYVLIDNSVIDTNIKRSKQITYIREAQEMLDNDSVIKLVWQTKDLSLYKTLADFDELEIISNLPQIFLPYSSTYIDQAYQDRGDYISSNEKNNTSYPFRVMLNDKKRPISNIVINPANNNYELYFNQTIIGKIAFPTFENIDSNFINNGGTIYQKKTSIFGKLPKPIELIKSSKVTFNDPVNNAQDQKIEHITGSNYRLDELFQYSAYLINFRSKNITGIPLRICIRNLYSQKCDIVDELTKKSEWVDDFFIVPPMHQGNGYQIEINSISLKYTPAINELASIKIWPFPLVFFNKIRIINNNINPSYKNNKIVLNDTFSFLKTGELFGDVSDNSTLVLNQAYEKNWKAYYVSNKIAKSYLLSLLSPLLGKKINNHVLVNNWANGWTISQSQLNQLKSVKSVENDKINIVIVFWPQYLEFVGFGILIISFLTVTKLPSK